MESQIRDYEELKATTIPRAGGIKGVCGDTRAQELRSPKGSWNHGRAAWQKEGPQRESLLDGRQNCTGDLVTVLRKGTLS